MFLFSALSILATVTFIQANPACNPNQMMTCVGPVIGWAMGEGAEISQTLQMNQYATLTGPQLVQACGAGREFMTCFTDYADRCLPEDLDDLRGVLRATTELAAKCDSPNFGAKAEKYVNCVQQLRQSSPEFDRCHKEMMASVQPQGPGQSLDAQLAEWRSGNKLRDSCCAQEKYNTCTAEPIRTTCGAETAEIAQNLNDAVISAFKCQGRGPCN